MFDYRLFFASSTLDGERDRRPQLAHEDKRITRLTADRRDARSKNRR
jgi:hypothetical protein